MVTRRIETRGSDALALVSRVMETHAALMRDRCPSRVVMVVDLPDKDSEDTLVSMLEGTLRMAPKRYAVAIEAPRKWTTPAAPLDIQPSMSDPALVPVNQLAPDTQRFILATLLEETPMDKAQYTALVNILIGRMIDAAVAERAK